MKLSITQNLLEKPITLAELKQFLKIDFDDHDSILNLCLESAISSASKFLNIPFCTKEFILNVHSNIEISEITLHENLKNKKLTLTSPSGEIKDNSIHFKSSQFGTFEVRLTEEFTGFIEPQLKQAILLHSAYLYENEEYSSVYIPAKIVSVYASFKKVKI